MTRRNLIRRLAAGFAAVVATYGVVAKDETYGYLDVETAFARGLSPQRARVFLNGVDVTDLKVQAADDRAGYIEVFERNANGQIIARNGHLVRVRRHGLVKVVFA